MSECKTLNLKKAPMKTNVYVSGLFLMIMLFATTSNAQVLVNKAWQDTTGNPQDTLTLQFALKDGSANYLTVGNTYATSDSEQLLITKYTNSGSKVWQVRVPSPSTKRLIATDVNIHNAYIYIASSPYDSVNNKSTFVTYKLSDSTGATSWVKQYIPSYTGYAVPAAIRVDSGGNVYVAGTEQTATSEYEMTVLKYNSSGTLQWTSHYDTSGLYTGGVGMSDIAKDSTFAVTGYSGNAFGTWDIITTHWNAFTGVLKSKSRVSNGSGGFISHPVALAKDGQDALYIVGASEISGPNIDIKVIKYDSLFNQIWVKTWGASDSLDDEPAYMVMDNSKNLIITGYTTHASGEVDLLTVKYDKNGNVLWSKTINNRNTSGTLIAKGASVAADDSGSIYVTGKLFNGSNYDIVTIAYDPNGNPLWEKNYDGGGGSNDIGVNVSVDTSKNVYVSGTIGTSTTKFITISYSQLNKGNVVLTDTSGKPLYVRNEMIIKFNPKEVSTSVVNNLDWQYGKLSSIIPDSVTALFASKIGVDQKVINALVVAKIFMRMTTADSISIGRLGDTVKMPSYWSTFLLEVPATWNLINTIDSFATLARHVVYAEPNYAGVLDNVPNDTYIQDGFEAGLIATTAYPNANININSAWDIETGKNYVKVGINDAVIDWAHEDFGDGTFSGSKIVGGWDFNNNVSAASSTNPTNSHGTACAGIIGALRNNGKGIAGIAGGDVSTGNTGCQLFTIGIFNGTNNFITSDKIGSAIVEGSAYNPGTGYGYGFNIESNSYNIGSNDAHFLHDAVKTCFQNQCVFIVSRGNDGNTNVTYPAGFDDPWVISVGASGTDGQHKTTLNGDNWWSSSYGGNVDLIAPGTTEIITAPQNVNYPFSFTCTNAINNNNYSCFNGTSASGPHVAGVAALMMSRHNVNQGYANNLAPDDVQNLVEEYATDVVNTPLGYGAGYDIYNGWGLLNAGATMAAINMPQYKVFHSGTPSTSTSTTVSTGTTMVLGEDFNGTAAGEYIADLVKVTQTYSNTFSSTTQILHEWPRLSSNVGVTAANPASGSPGGTYNFTITGNTASVTATTYAWHITGDIIGDYMDVWVPDVTANLKTAYSLHLYDPSVTGVEETFNITNCSIYPNPTQDLLYASVVLAQAENISISLTDITGRVLDVKKLEGADHYLTSFNTGSLASGLYFCTIQTNSTQQVKKFVKQ